MKNPVKVQIGKLDLTACSTVSQEIVVLEESDKLEKVYYEIYNFMFSIFFYFKGERNHI